MIDAGRPFFRFTGAAGNRLLDHCVPDYSCGTAAVMWSNAQMPTQIGVLTRIFGYRSFSSGCQSHDKIDLSVMRCSDHQYDFIYRYDDSNSGCNDGFCGMD